METVEEIFNDNCTLINKDYREYIIRNRKRFIKEIKEHASEQTVQLKKNLKNAESMFEKMELTAFNLEKRIAKLEELVKAYEEYARLLGKSEGNLAVFAATHRIYVDKKTVNKGKQLRKRIEELSINLE